ncbi:Mannan endo-1,6-alpha-mannosidase DCW1 [Cladobotryum mycophilum]|uniref:mannan endo-1,6-alpha-mannosidase n=1 Tax=Cladobotryum mycophilum TaxID=491253 RepID=A0ABR0SG64_9HYPO
MDRYRGASLLGRLVAALLLVASPFTTAYTLDPDSTESITSIAKQMTQDMLSFYNGDKPGGTPGLLPQPYYWWEAGAMMGALVDYWYYTQDDEFVDLTKQGFLFQVGETKDYMPRNQTRTEGNDDQGFWGLAVMSAAEYNFPNPNPDQPQWLALAQAVFNTQAARWDKEHCNGGLRWQIFTWNNGYDYKNTISQACFFALGARLALYTGNSSYADWAETTWDWMLDVNFIDQKSWYVYDGANIGTGCTDIVPYQWSYNAGGFILGAAAMYNYTEDPKWKERLDNLLEGAKVFFTGPDNNIMTEVACEPVNLCNLDQQSFKAYLSRWLANVTKWAPYTYDTLMPLLRASAVAAAKQCVGGDNGRMCGLVWNKNKYDGSTGVGQQMAAMEVTLSLMIKDRHAPVTDQSGGTSKGDPGGGGADIGRTTPNGPQYKKITGGDRFGAAVITLIVLGSALLGLIWLFLDETSDKTPVDQFKGFQSSATAAIAAFAAGGAAAGALDRKSEKDVNEKRPAAGGVMEDRGKGIASMTVAHVRQGGEGRPRRVSSMPLGWPHNPSVRSSMVESGNEQHPLESAAYVSTDGEHSPAGQSSHDEQRH